MKKRSQRKISKLQDSRCVSAIYALLIGLCERQLRRCVHLECCSPKSACSVFRPVLPSRNCLHSSVEQLVEPLLFPFPAVYLP